MAHYLSKILVLAAISLSATAVSAADLPNIYLKMIGQDSTQNMHKQLMGPYFTKEITENSGGSVTVTYNTSDAVGLHGAEAVRLVGMGVFDIATGALSYLAGEDPRFEGMDLPGLTLDLNTQRKVSDAYKPVIAKRVEKTHNVKLVGLYPIGLEVWYCRTPITGLKDVKGKKVRVYNVTMADFVKAAGGSTVNIPFAEVVPAMHRGVADCALTGTSSGNTARWWEVTNYLYNVPMGWAMQFLVANLDSWNRLDPDVRAFLEEEFATLEDKAWALMERDIQDGIDCNLGKECKYGVKAEDPMELVEFTAEDKALHRKIMEEAVVKNWAGRCGKECAASWNDTIGKIVGITATAD